jgi:hypothetical protein
MVEARHGTPKKAASASLRSCSGFSRALEDRTEDQYYVETKYEFSGTGNQHAMAKKILRLASWFFEGVLSQLFGWYPEQDQHYNSQ